MYFCQTKTNISNSLIHLHPTSGIYFILQKYITVGNLILSSQNSVSFSGRFSCYFLCVKQAECSFYNKTFYIKSFTESQQHKKRKGSSFEANGNISFPDKWCPTFKRSSPINLPWYMTFH